MTIAFAATLLILFIGWAGSALGLQYLLGVILPLVAGAVFIIGFIWKIVRWAKSPVPFAIPTVAGQQRSLDWIKPNRLECPWTTPAVIGRMILPVAVPQHPRGTHHHRRHAARHLFFQQVALGVRPAVPLQHAGDHHPSCAFLP